MVTAAWRVSGNDGSVVDDDTRLGAEVVDIVVMGKAIAAPTWMAVAEAVPLSIGAKRNVGGAVVVVRQRGRCI